MSKLHVTTVRFDADSWADLCQETERLGIAKAAFIRDAALVRLARAQLGSNMTELSERLETVEDDLASIRRELRRRRAYDRPPAPPRT